MTSIPQCGDLLTHVVESAAGTFQTRLASGLQNSRSFVLPVADAQPKPTSEFELVTWLVIANDT